MTTVSAYFLGICTHIEAAKAGLQVDVPPDALQGSHRDAHVRRSILVDATKPRPQAPFDKIDPHLPLLCIPAKCTMSSEKTPGLRELIPGLWQLDGVRLYIRHARPRRHSSPKPRDLPSLTAQAPGEPLRLSQSLARDGNGAAAFFDTFGAHLRAFEPEGKKGSSVALTVDIGDETPPELVVVPFASPEERFTIGLTPGAPLLFSNSGIFFGTLDTEMDFWIHYLVAEHLPKAVDVDGVMGFPGAGVPTPAEHRDQVERFLAFLWCNVLFSATSGGVGCSNSTYP